MTTGVYEYRAGLLALSNARVLVCGSVADETKEVIKDLVIFSQEFLEFIEIGCFCCAIPAIETSKCELAKLGSGSGMLL